MRLHELEFVPSAWLSESAEEELEARQSKASPTDLSGRHHSLWPGGGRVSNGVCTLLDWMTA
jgi:hypothetical protein